MSNTTPAKKVRPVDAGHDHVLLRDTVLWLLARRSKTVSASAIQRGMRVGFAKAGRLLELLADAGVIERSARSLYVVLFDRGATDSVLAALDGCGDRDEAAGAGLEEVALHLTTHRDDGVRNVLLADARIPAAPGRNRETAIARMLWNAAADTEAKFAFRAAEPLAQLDLGLLMEAMAGPQYCVCTDTSRCAVHAHVHDNLDTVRRLLRAALRPRTGHLDDLALAIDYAVRRLHYPISIGGEECCRACSAADGTDLVRVPWECPTIRAVNEVLAGVAGGTETPR